MRSERITLLDVHIFHRLALDLGVVYVRLPISRDGVICLLKILGRLLSEAASTFVCGQHEQALRSRKRRIENTPKIVVFYGLIRLKRSAFIHILFKLLYDIPQIAARSRIERAYHHYGELHPL